MYARALTCACVYVCVLWCASVLSRFLILLVCVTCFVRLMLCLCRSAQLVLNGGDLRTWRGRRAVWPLCSRKVLTDSPFVVFCVLFSNYLFVFHQHNSGRYMSGLSSEQEQIVRVALARNLGRAVVARPDTALTEVA